MVSTATGQPTHHKVVIGDSRCMHTVGNGTVHLVVTSPPYWQLKDYGSRRQIGFNDSYEDYIDNLNLVWRECHRVLASGCRLCVNIGDQFARSIYYGRYKVIPIQTEIIRFCETVGFDYMGTIIWQKTTTMNTTGGGSVMGSYPYPRNGIVKIDYESILLFKKIGTPTPVKIHKDIKDKSQLTAEEWHTYFSGHWNFKGERQHKHIAMFPEELPKRLIKMFSFVGDTVLDPFLGSGTTSRSAMRLARSSVGYEINRNFREIIKDKLDKVGTLLNPAHVDFFCENTKGLSDEDCEQLKQKLPYRFKDPTKMERKIDPTKFGSGSKIDARGTGVRKETFHRVRDIIAPDTLLLNKGIKVRLIGIDLVPTKKEDAMNFMRKKALGQKVYMAFEDEKRDEKGNLLCYLYLANKTFINAQLIKSGFAVADRCTTHKYLDKFMRYEGAAYAERMDTS